MFNCRSLADVKSEYHNLPRMAPNAIKFLDVYLMEDMNVFEWGSGGSTTWIAERVSHIYSVEHCEHWYNFLKTEIEEMVLNNITLYHRPTETKLPSDGDRGLPLKNYYTPIEELNMKFDVIIIDGMTNSRNKCMEIAIKYLKDPGGIIVFDDFASFRFDRSREMVREWQITNYSKGGNTTAVLKRGRGL